MTEKNQWRRKTEGFFVSPQEALGKSILDALQQEGDISIVPEGAYIPDYRVATLAPWELKALGLPEAAPFRLEVWGQGPISRSDFQLKYRLLRSDGRPILNPEEDGALVRSGSKNYVLLDPLFTVVKKVRAFTEIGADMDARFEQWAAIKEILPSDAIVADQLQTIKFVRSDSFTLDVHENAQFDPVLLSKTREDNQEEFTGDPQECLPPAHHKKFAKRFRDACKVSQRYALGGGWYLLVPENTRKALSVVQEWQREPSVARRQAFIANPYAALREELGAELSDEDIEDLFIEKPSFLSDRVKCLGQWEPKHCAYVSIKGKNWIPEEVEGLSQGEEVGVLLGDQYVSVNIDDVPNLIEKIEEAQSSGQSSIEYNGLSLSANEDSLEALERLLPKEQSSVDKSTENQEDPTKESLVPIVIDNLEELGYQVKKPRRCGQVGEIPHSLSAQNLYLHQREGLEWLQQAWVEGLPGGLLADDMGLGKTLQTLAFMAWVQGIMDNGNYKPKPILIVAPTGLLKTWESENDKHLVAPGLGKLVKAYGSALRSLEQEGHYWRSQELQSADWVMTTYETLRDRIHTFLPIDWAIVAFDEAQKLKNPGARVTEMAKSIKADFVITLTGTPVENSLSDLWSIMDATCPGLLGSLKSFRDKFQKPAEEEGDFERARLLRHTLEDEVTPPAIIRRIKDDYLKGLPQKFEKPIDQEMPPEQAEAYTAVLRRGAQEQGKQGSMLEAINSLRKTSLIPYNLDTEGITDKIVQTSARLKATMEVLDNIYYAGEKVLIFLEFLDLQEALVPYLQQRFDLDEPPARINGRVGGEVRKKFVDKFQNKLDGYFDVMLLSPRAGGVGITLTKANHIIHLSRWWNPAVEDQCTDRVYRIGQSRDIYVYYPLAVHPEFKERSFDKNLHELLDRKRSLSRSVMTPPQVTENELNSLWNKAAGNE